MNDLYKKGFELINSGQYQDAFDEFSKIIMDNKNDYFARFYRGLIVFSYFPERIEDAITDFEYLVERNRKFVDLAKSYLSIIYCNIEQPLKAIAYGEEAVKSDNEEVSDLLIDLYYSLTRAYFQLGDKNSLELALKSIDYCINAEPNEFVDFYIFKIDILNNLDNYEESINVLSTLYTKFGSSFIYYYLLSKVNVLLYRSTQNVEYLDTALSNIDIALQYEEKHINAIFSKIEIYSLQKEPDKAFLLLDTIKENFNQEEYLIEKFKILEECEDYDKIISLCEEYLKENESWQIYYSLGYFKSRFVKTKIDAEEVRDIFKRAYLLDKSELLFIELYRYNFYLGYDLENLKIINEMISIYPEDGSLYFFLGETKQRLNYDYDEVIDEFTKSYNFKYLDELRYYTLILPLVKNPSKYYKYVKKYSNIDVNKLSFWSARQIGIRYLYGQEGYRKNIVKARKYLDYAYQNINNVSCMITTYARLLEFENKYDEAFMMYKKAYECEKAETFQTCNCAYGYLAHAYINGIGTDVNIDKAKQLILDGLEVTKEKSSNIVIYLYTYFALLNEENFDLNTAKELLELKYPFCRYEISKSMMLKRIYLRLNLDTSKIDKEIWNCRWKGDSFNSKYYFKNRKKDIIYPDLNNY